MKKFLYCLALVILFAASTGCGRNRQEESPVTEESTENSIWIYYPQGRELVRRTELYRLKQPDSLSSSVEETMGALMEELDGEKLEFRTYMLDGDNNVSLEFVQKSDCSKEYLLLAKAAVTTTLFQMEEIGSVSICLYDSGNNVISNEPFFRTSFYFYGSGEDGVSQNVTLYYGNETGTDLVSETVQVSVGGNTTLEEKIVDALCERGAIPKDTKVNSVSYRSGVCYLDLSGEFANSLENVKSDIVLYSVVNSVTTITGKVQILINGEIPSSYWGNTSVSEPLGFNYQILQ